MDSNICMYTLVFMPAASSFRWKQLGLLKRAGTARIACTLLCSCPQQAAQSDAHLKSHICRKSSIIPIAVSAWVKRMA